jgi:hypothetical protein
VDGAFSFIPPRKGEHERLVVRERHAMCLRRVTLDFCHEPVLVRGAGLESG